MISPAANLPKPTLRPISPSPRFGNDAPEFFKPDQLPPSPPGPVKRGFSAVKNWLFPSTNLTLKEIRLDNLLDKLMEKIKDKSITPTPDRIYIDNDRYCRLPFNATEVKIGDSTYQLSRVREEEYISRAYRWVTRCRLSRSDCQITLSVDAYRQLVSYNDSEGGITIESKNRYLARKTKRFFKALETHCRSRKKAYAREQALLARMKEYQAKIKEAEEAKKLPELRI